MHTLVPSSDDSVHCKHINANKESESSPKESESSPMLSDLIGIDVLAVGKDVSLKGDEILLWQSCWVDVWSYQGKRVGVDS
ncbi:hypothetical protein BTVI_20073 [Pitangus sulphuratus]|nr:hypothetical protein BTVI_20073 [Pitangus sulphuratus]